ncbi:MAG TPA: glycosyl hydrolase 108 family protein [Burkholderiales bacterium]|nr:glycosyl hydrolase 108 family protein [Burkholderiales bacterium]
MADFDPAVAKTLIREGGARFTDNPDDRGGPTKYGISQNAYPNVDIRNLSEDQAKAIYKKNYWDRVSGDTLKSQAIAENIFDTAVNMGPTTATKLVQVTLGLEIDGRFGPATAKAVNASDESEFLAGFTLAKVARYAAICNKDRTQSKFLLGWINRALGSAS